MYRYDPIGIPRATPRVSPASGVEAYHCRDGRANVFLFRETALVHLGDERVNGEHDVQHVHGNKGKERAQCDERRSS
jgi:hypothetical protein